MAAIQTKNLLFSNCAKKLRKPSSILQTVVLVLLFITLACCRTFLIKFSIRDGGYDYLPVTVNVMAELGKFLVCFIMSLYVILYKEERSLKEAFDPTKIKWLGFFKWSIPGLLYFIDNLLGFYILVHLPPALYSLFGNFVIITTAVLFRIVLRKKLSSIQWAALVILFLSIVALSSNSSSSSNHHHHHHHHQVVLHHSQQISDSIQSSYSICRHQALITKNLTCLGENDSKFQIHKGHVLVLIQCFLSSSANIYNEKIFKEGNGMDESIYIQNSRLYFFGIVFNFITLLLKKDFREHLFDCGFFGGYNIQSTLLIFVTACFGLTVALILKFRDNMFQVMSFQLTNVLIITSSVLFFDFRPTLEFFLTAPIVLLAIFIYNVAKKDVKASSQYENKYSALPTEDVQN